MVLKSTTLDFSQVFTKDCRGTPLAACFDNQSLGRALGFISVWNPCLHCIISCQAKRQSISKPLKVGSTPQQFFLIFFPTVLSSISLSSQTLIKAAKGYQCPFDVLLGNVLHLISTFIGHILCFPQTYKECAPGLTATTFQGFPFLQFPFLSPHGNQFHKIPN